MVYKKYITRGGKTYGPYIYHSRRENGRVITEYHGKKSNKKFFKIFLWFFLGIFILIGLYFITSNFNLLNPTGLASLQLATNYKPNEPVDGVLRLSLLRGELIPEDTSVIIDIAGEEHIYSLAELISEDGFEGNYYIKDSGVSGSGLGYGSQGSKYSYPEVSFKLNVVDTSESSSEIIEGDGTLSETTGSETSLNESNISETEVTPTESQQNESPTETPINIEEIPTITGETSETPTETEASSSENIGASTENTEETPTETSSESNSESSGGSESAPSTESATSITGSIIHFFTGLVSLKIVEEGNIEGNVVYGENVEYNLPEGKTALLVEGSVSSIGKTIDDSYIDVSVNNGVATVSTNYKQAEYGFGEDYVGDEKVYYDLNLSKLDLTAKEGEVNIKLVFEDSVLVETNSNLAVSKEELNASEQNISISAEPFKLEDSSIYDLTEDEVNLLIKKAGTISVNTTKSEIFNGRFVVRYELGDYWTEFSYDYSGKLSKELLDKVELERKYWLKNLAKELSKEFAEAENVNGLIVGFNLNESNNLRLKKGNFSENVSKEEVKQEETNETEETQIPETTEETSIESSSEVLANETTQTETPIETNLVSPEITETQNPEAETPLENTEQSPEESASTITGQIVSQPQSQIKLFDRIKRFSEKIIRDIREAFN